MPRLNLTPDELLTTTRSVRKRLDFSRPVEPEIIQECLQIAVQAPTGGNRQTWHFVVVTDAEKRKALGEIYRKGYAIYRQQNASVADAGASKRMTPERIETLKKVISSSEYLAEHMHEVPVLVVPCMFGRVEGLNANAQAGMWGSILPSVWSFMLAARERGLGTCWTTIHLFHEEEAAQVLGLPFEKVTQTSLIPVAYTLGTEFKPGSRVSLESVVHR